MGEPEEDKAAGGPGSSKNDPIVLVVDDSDDGSTLDARKYDDDDQRKKRKRRRLAGNSFDEKKDDDDESKNRKRQDGDDDVQEIFPSQRADPLLEHDMMKSSADGRAVLVVQKIIQLVESFKIGNPNLAKYVDAVAIDDMVFLAKRVLDLQAQYVSSKRNGFIDIGYHYTRPENLNQIRTSGLLNKRERKSRDVTSKTKNASVFGDGIYTGNYPISFRKYGPVGLLVGRLQGKAIRVPEKLMISPRDQVDANTIVGDKTAMDPYPPPECEKSHDRDGWPKSDEYHEVVLRSSSQCLPMIKFYTKLLDEHDGEHYIRWMQLSLQTILDQLLNEGEGLQRHFSRPPLKISLSPVAPHNRTLDNLIRKKRIKALSFLAHGETCPSCSSPACKTAKKLLKHWEICKDKSDACTTKYCAALKKNFRHYKNCNSNALPCPICPFVRKDLATLEDPEYWRGIFERKGALPVRRNQRLSQQLAGLSLGKDPTRGNTGRTPLGRKRQEREDIGKFKPTQGTLSLKSPPSAPEAKWVCPQCTVINDITTNEAQSCRFCGYQKHSAAVAARPTPKTSSLKSPPSAPGAKWVCTQCTFINDFTFINDITTKEAQSCQLCLSVRPSSAVLEKPDLSSLKSPPSTPNVSPSILKYTAPVSFTAGIQFDVLTEPADNQAMNEACIICHDTLSSNHCSALTVCSHVFHTACVQEAFKRKPECPVCRKAVSAPQGKSPSGSMEVSVVPMMCSGFSENTIAITYVIQAGIQMNYHDNPGHPQTGKHVKAYLPNNTDGQQLLKRLKYAFMHGLIFTVGTSATTGKPNQCTWASIHHKTSLSGGIQRHGFPDPNYFVNCNEELDGLGVPAARLLRDDGSDV